MKITQKHQRAAAIAGGLALLAAATAAYAAVVSASGAGGTRVLACQAAKTEAVRVIGVNYSVYNGGVRRVPDVSRFSECDCSDQGDSANRSWERWQCSVDAQFQPLN